MGADQKGANPTPVIPTTWGVDGNTPTPVSASNPLPVSIAGATSAAQGTQNTVDVTNVTQVVKTTVQATKLLVLVNNGANDCYWSISGTAVSGAAAATNGGAVIKAGGGAVVLSDLGALTVAVIAPSGDTVLAVGRVA